MPFHVIKGDLVSMNVDVIVNAANVGLRMVEGVGRAIFHNAGDIEMNNACKKIGRCEVGKCVATPSFNIKNCKEIFHAVAPIYTNGKHGEVDLLISSYITSLNLAKERGYNSIAFPLLGGDFNWPINECYQLGKKAILDYLKANDECLDVFMVIYKNYPKTIDDSLQEALTRFMTMNFRIENKEPQVSDKAFREMFLKAYQESGLTIEELAYKANKSVALIKRVIDDETIVPGRNLMLSLGVALKMNSAELAEFLSTCGYVLNRANLFDLIIIYFVDNGNYDVYEINDALFMYDYGSLGDKQ